MKMRKLALLLIAILAVCLVFCGCERKVREDSGAAVAGNGGGNPNKKKVDIYGGEEVKIAYIAHDLGTPNNQGWKEGIERECASWPNIKVDSYGAEEKADKQVEIMTNCINQQYNAIIIQCSDGAALAPSVAQAEEAGIPVITLNLDCSSDTVHSALVMAVDYDAGRMAADKMAEQIGGEGKIAIIEGVPGLERTDNLERGFIDTVKDKYPGIEIVAQQSASFQKNTARTVMESFMQQHADLKGVFAINDAMAEGAALAANNAGKQGQICIWGADGEKIALEMIEEGSMAGTIYTNSWDEGSTAAKIALLMISSDYDSAILTETPKVIMEPIVVTKETVGDISEEDRW